MIELAHQPAPASLTRFQRYNPNSSWGDLPSDVKDDIHDALDVIQQNLCVYCETTIDREKCHLEHLQPKSRYPHLALTYLGLNSPDLAQQRRNYIQIVVSLGPDDAKKFMWDQPFRHILAELAG